MSTVVHPLNNVDKETTLESSVQPVIIIFDLYLFPSSWKAIMDLNLKYVLLFY